MFSSRTADEVRAQNEKLTGLERAKLERTQQPAPAPQVQPTPPPPVNQPKPAAVPPQKVEVRPVVRPSVQAPAANASAAAQLIVGPGVTLKGDVLDCDLLRIEGNVEGNVKARKLVVVAGGTLVGTAEIDDSEIEGRFEGTLTVGGLLIVRSQGRATGKFSYADIEIERGGRVSGEVQVGKQSQTGPADPKRGLRP